MEDKRVGIDSVDAYDVAVGAQLAPTKDGTRCLFRKFLEPLPDGWRKEFSAQLAHGNEYHILRGDGSVLLTVSEHVLIEIAGPTESKRDANRSMVMKASATGTRWHGRARFDFSDGGTPGNVVIEFAAVSRDELDMAIKYYMTATRLVDKAPMPDCEP